VETRLAKTEDAPFLYEVYSSTRMDEVSAWGWEEHDRNAFLSIQWIMQKNSYQLQFPDAENLIISYEGLNAGRLMLYRTTEKIHLIDISLLPSFRNHGVGSSLLKTLQHEALMKQQIIELHVTPHNPARRLYERLGFQLHESLDFYWKMVWQPMKSNVDL
jgi:ribosomal protein S18 acetylase RimI-like enzyme